MSAGLTSLRRRTRNLFEQGANDELLDGLAASTAGRALTPLAKLLHRNASLSLNYEIARGLALAFTYAEAEEVTGDYAEFTVAKGRNFLEALRQGAGRDESRRFFAFDSFAGLPPIEGRDRRGRFREGQFAFSRDAFEARLRRAGAPRDRVHIVEAPHTELPALADRIPLERVAIAYVDSPTYAPTVPVLDYLSPRLADGAVLMFDAWLCFHADPDLGQAAACSEWLAGNPGLELSPAWQYNWAGQAFIVRRRGDATDLADAPQATA